MAGGWTQLEVACSTDLATSISHPSSKWGVLTEKDECIITIILLSFYFTFCKTYNPFQYHFSLLYFNILLFPFMDTNDLTCTCVFDFIAFTCRLNWMNYAFKFPFFYTLLPSLLPSQAILVFI